MSSVSSCASESAKEDLPEKCTNITAGTLENSGDIINTSYRLQTSHCSTISNDSELSSLSLCLDRELECHADNIDTDELPAFEIRLISPLGRSPSPINSEDMETPTRPQYRDCSAASLYPSTSDYVTLQDINAQISPPNDRIGQLEDETCLSRSSSLETIFEGVFLNTTPRHRNNQRRCHSSLLEKVVLNRLCMGKENKSPSAKEDTKPASSLDLRTLNKLENGLS